METTEIKRILIQCINQIQELNGLPWVDINDYTRPVGDLEGFDSLIMVELAVRLSSLITLDLEDEIFYADPKSAQGRISSLGVRDIVENINQFMISQKG